MTSPNNSGAERRRYAARLPREVRRAQILDAAARLIAEHGWQGMTMERVAAEAGVAKSVSYAIFESRARLQRAVMRRAQEVTGERVERALAAARDADGLGAALAAGLTSYLESVAREPEISRLVLLPIEGAPEGVREAVREGRERVRGQVLAVVKDRLARVGAGASGLDAELLSHLVRDNAENLARLLLEHPGTFTPRRLAGSVGELLAAVTGARQPSGYGP
ncbi:TetR/AcrR family transcriptional regulator [Streptomyces sp. NPDC048172]|uniref:TetR/AcrR family transcriptional regulator n=1 Tax=Streptomyces sp. NPDC048172 TaxID=3365505 RepID=UPI00371BD66D